MSKIYLLQLLILILNAFSSNSSWAQTESNNLGHIKVYWCTLNSERKELEVINNIIRCKGQPGCNVPLSQNTELLVYNLLGQVPYSALSRKFAILNITQPAIYPLTVLIINDVNTSSMPDINLYRWMRAVTSDQKIRTHTYSIPNSGTVLAFGNEYFRSTTMAELDQELDNLLFNITLPTRSESQQLSQSYLSPLQGVMRLAYHNPNGNWNTLLHSSVKNYVPVYDSLSSAAKQALQMQFEAAKTAFNSISLTPNSNKVIELTEEFIRDINADRKLLVASAMKAGYIYFNYKFSMFMSTNDSRVPTTTFLTKDEFLRHWCSLEDNKIVEAIADKISLSGRLPIDNAQCNVRLASAGIVLKGQPDSNLTTNRRDIEQSLFQLQKDLEKLFQNAEVVYRGSRGVVSPDLAAYEKKALWYQIFSVYVQKHNARFYEITN